MAAYSLLFSVAVTHTYFADSIIPYLLIEPDPLTKNILDNLNLIFRQVEGGFNVYYDTSVPQPDHMNIYQGKKLSFILRVADPCFLNYTLLPPYTNSLIFYFSNVNHKPAGKQSAGLPLTAEKTVGVKDIFQLSPSLYAQTLAAAGSVPSLTGIFGNTVQPLSVLGTTVQYNNLNGIYYWAAQKNKSVFYAGDFAYKTKPLAVIDFFLYEKGLDPDYSVFPLSAQLPKNFTLAFDSPSVIWRYYVINKTNIKVDNLSIASTDNKIMFVSKGKVDTFDHPAYVIESESEIKMQEYPAEEYNLTLKNGKNKVILNEIILPSAETLKTENNINYTDTYIYI